MIASIQQGSITIAASSASQTATVTAVDTSKSFLKRLGHTTTPSTGSDAANVRIELTNSTTVTAYRGMASAVSSVTVNFRLTEYT